MIGMNQMAKNMEILKEWDLLNLGRFVAFNVMGDTWAEIIFERETLVLSGEEDDHSGGEIVATIDSKPTEGNIVPTPHELADFDFATRDILFTLTNGDEYGLSIHCSTDEDEEADEIYTYEFIF